MRSRVRGIRRPLTDEELGIDSTQEKVFGGNEMDTIVQKISLEKVSLEERRKEAKKPMYLVRYE
jgi:hypothetical protein